MLTATPINKVTANPATMDAPNLVPNQNRMMQVMNVATLLSRIDDQALEKPISIAFAKPLPVRSSSFVLSNINTLASTAIPTERMNPATPAKVKVTGMSLKIASVISV